MRQSSQFVRRFSFDPEFTAELLGSGGAESGLSVGSRPRKGRSMWRRSAVQSGWWLACLMMASSIAACGGSSGGTGSSGEPRPAAGEPPERPLRPGTEGARREMAAKQRAAVPALEARPAAVASLAAAARRGPVLAREEWWAPQVLEAAPQDRRAAPARVATPAQAAALGLAVPPGRLVAPAGGGGRGGAAGAAGAGGAAGNQGTAQDAAVTTTAIVSVGDAATCAIVGGDLKCWGDGDAGQLGDGNTNNTLGPAQVVGLTTGVTAVAIGQNLACAVAGGGVQCWGEVPGNTSTFMCGAVPCFVDPTPVPGLSGVVSVGVSLEVGDVICVLTASGAVQCWGNNVLGAVGDGTTTFQSAPVQVVGLTAGVKALSVGGRFSCAITAVGAVQCWGGRRLRRAWSRGSRARTRDGHGLAEQHGRCVSGADFRVRGWRRWERLVLGRQQLRAARKRHHHVQHRGTGAGERLCDWRPNRVGGRECGLRACGWWRRAVLGTEQLGTAWQRHQNGQRRAGSGHGPHERSRSNLRRRG